MEPMNALQYLTSKETGCCSTKELMELARVDKAAVEALKDWARQEMTSKNIPQK